MLAVLLREEHQSFSLRGHFLHSGTLDNQPIYRRTQAKAARGGLAAPRPLGVGHQVPMADAGLDKTDRQDETCFSLDPDNSKRSRDRDRVAGNFAGIDRDR